MNCTKVAHLLSPFFDGELDAERHHEVAEHLIGCDSCTAKLRALKSLSELVDQQPVPSVPGTLLRRVEQTLSGASSSRNSLESKKTVYRGLLALAAFVLIGLAAWLWNSGPEHDHAEMNRTFGHFLAALEKAEPHSADLLAVRYGGQEIDEKQASLVLKRDTVARPVLTSGFKETKRVLLKMPCCDCVQTNYSNDEGQTLVLIEHDKEQSEWFGARPMVRAECGGTKCCMVQLENGLAASWPIDGGHVTAIGLQDVSELERLVTELRTPNASRS